MLSAFWILVLIFSTMYTVQSGSCPVTGLSSTPPDVYQSEKELSRKIGDSAALQCCIFGEKDREIIWFKQQDGKLPQIIVRFFKTSGGKFYQEFLNSRFQIEKRSNCFNLTISNLTKSDEATYYCALMFAVGTHLKIQDEHVNITSETLCENSVACESTTVINTPDKTERETIRSLHGTVLGLGTALGLCALLIICLAYFLLRRRTCDEMKTTTGDSSERKQESEDEMINYAALQFNKRKVNTAKRKTGLSDHCVYASVE